MAKIILRAGKVAIKIVLPLVILGLIFYSVKVHVLAQDEPVTGPEELVAEFEQAESYLKEGQYEEAEQIYWGILDRYPGTDDALAAQRQLTILYINWDKPADAEAALESLVTNYGDEAAISAAVYRVADALSETRPDKAITLYQQILDTWPNYDKAMWGWGQVDVVRSHLLLKNEANAWAVYQEMLADFSEDEELSGAVCEAAEAYLNDGSNPQKAVELYEYAMNRWPDYSLTDENRMILANGYLNLKPPKPQKALEQFQHVLDEWPGTEAAMWSQAGVMKVNILLGNEIAAESAYQALLNQFGSNEDIPKAVCDVADYWRDIDATKSLELYENALSSWPDYVNPVTDDHIVHWENIAILRLQFGNDAGSRVAFEKIINNYSKLEGGELGVAISEVTGAYLNLGKVQEALELCQYAQEKLSGTEHEIWAIVGLVKSDIALGNDPNITKELDELIAEFANSPDLPKAILETGLAYYKKALYRAMEGDTEREKAFYQEAISVWERLLEEFPDSEAAASAYFRSGVCYAQELGEYQNGIDYFQAIIDNQPDYEFVSGAHFLIARFTRKLRDTGAIADPNANILIKEAYQAVVENYPDCVWAEQALLNLGRMCFDQAQLEDAIMYFEMLLEKFPEKVCLVGNDLSQAYEQVQDVEMAALMRAELAENNCPGM